jgi:hypothetical protein
MSIILRDKTTPSQQLAIQSDGSALVQPQAITKGTQGANGFTVQDLKDSGRTTLSWIVDRFASTAATEALLTVTESRNGAATSTWTSVLVTSGKRLRIQHLSAFLKATTSSTPALQSCHIGLRFNTAGAATASSPLVWRGALGTNLTTALGSVNQNWDFPDGLEFLGDGTKQIGISAIFPEWVTAASIASLTMACIAFEY